jgi:predicted O-methyltransferase YrrM
MYFSIALNVILLVGLFAALWKIKNQREYRKKRGLFRPWPVRQVAPDAFDPAFATRRYGPQLDSAITLIANFRVEGGISDFETWFLCNLAKSARSVFELGTCTGKTTYLLAANTPDTSRITTLTLGPDDLELYQDGAQDIGSAKRSALKESQFADFFYTGTPEAAKITQLFGDSKSFDETPYLQSFDLIFIDGSHAYSYVMSDSRKALKMVRPGGVIVWHDYCGPRRARDVFRALNDLSKELPLVHIQGTTMVAYRAPSA